MLPPTIERLMLKNTPRAPERALRHVLIAFGGKGAEKIKTYSNTLLGDL